MKLHDNLALANFVLFLRASETSDDALHSSNQLIHRPATRCVTRDHSEQVQEESDRLPEAWKSSTLMYVSLQAYLTPGYLTQGYLTPAFCEV